jgi:hypothetical protein
MPNAAVQPEPVFEQSAATVCWAFYTSRFHYPFVPKPSDDRRAGKKDSDQDGEDEWREI